MSELHDESVLRELLQRAEKSYREDPESKHRTREHMLASFDEALEQDTPRQILQGSTDPNTAEGGSVAEPFELFEAIERESRRGPLRRAGRPLLVAAASIAAVAISMTVWTGGDGDRITATEDVPTEYGLARVDASVLVPGLVFDVDEEFASVEEVEPGLMVLEIRVDLSPAGASTDLTLIAVDSWGPALLAPDVPRLKAPDSLNSWLALSGQEASTFVPFQLLDPLIDSESWRVRLLPEVEGCLDGEPSGQVALSSAGSSVSLVTCLTNELTSIQFPGAPTILVHASYSGSSQLAEPVGAEILKSMRIE